MQTKALQLNLKDLDMGKREVVVMHATYKTLDRDKDRSNRGMFDKSWKENSHLIRLFVNHDKTQAPGKPLQFWDDAEGAYTKAKIGTHTLGEDTLKMLDEGVIQAVSFGFLPIKVKEIKGKGNDLLEVQHMETSLLTHWGAHDDSRIVSVQKALGLKELTSDEAAVLRKLIENGMDSLQAAINLAASAELGTDMYASIHYIITRQSEQIGDLKNQLRWGLKESMEFSSRISKMESFIRNSKASDETIQMVEKELSRIKKLLNKHTDTANTDPSLIKCPQCATLSVGIEDEAGRIKCAECSHVLKGAGQPDASSDKSELRRKLLLLKSKLI
jgi:HK97 family phage prohead protease